MSENWKILLGKILLVKERKTIVKRLLQFQNYIYIKIKHVILSFYGLLLCCCESWPLMAEYNGIKSGYLVPLKM